MSFDKFVYLCNYLHNQDMDISIREVSFVLSQ